MKLKTTTKENQSKTAIINDTNTEFIKEENPCISQLHIGQIIPNYKKLCELLSIPVKTGEAKISQIKKLQRYISFERTGQKYIVKDIYTVPLPLNDKRIKETTKNLESILLCNLQKEVIGVSSNSLFDYSFENEYYCFYKSKLFKYLYLVNSDYGLKYDELLNKYSSKYPEIVNVSQHMLSIFYMHVNSRLTQILTRALDGFQKRNLLTYDIKYRIFTSIQTPDSIKHESHFATDQEILNLQSAENKVLKENFNCSDSWFIFSNGLQDAFYWTTQKKTRELYGWDHYAKQYIIKLNNDYKNYFNNKIDCEKKMNSNIYTTLVKYSYSKYKTYLNSKEKYKKDIEEYNKANESLYISQDLNNLIEATNDNTLLSSILDINEPKEPVGLNKLPDSYLDDFQLLLDILIRID